MYIMVLNDGETWTELQGCKIVYLDTNHANEVNDERVKRAYEGLMNQADEIATEFK